MDCTPSLFSVSQSFLLCTGESFLLSPLTLAGVNGLSFVTICDLVLLVLRNPGTCGILILQYAWLKLQPASSRYAAQLLIKKIKCFTLCCDNAISNATTKYI